MSTAVADTSFLIALHSLNSLHLIRDVFGHIIILPAVLREVAVEGKSGATEIQNCPWIRIQALRDAGAAERLKAVLDDGEAEVISLALETSSAIVLLYETQT